MGLNDIAATAKPVSVLIVDDDRELAGMLAEYLTDEGFALHHLETGEAALEFLSHKIVDLIVLDVMMPGISGFDVLTRRKGRTIPVIMLTARGDDNDRILGLELGADDYLGKPFNPKELVARIRAIIRRRDLYRQVNGASISIGPLTLDPSNMGATLGDRSVRLTAAEFYVLEMLARAAGLMQTRAALTEQALGRPLEAFDRSIDTHVSNLRRKLNLKADAGIEIRSVRGVGYLLAAAGAGL